MNGTSDRVPAGNHGTDGIPGCQRGAADGTRTRNSQLGRLELYQLNYGRKLVGPAGFEPTTLCSQSRCATKLRYGPT